MAELGAIVGARHSSPVQLTRLAHLSTGLVPPTRNRAGVAIPLTLSHERLHTPFSSGVGDEEMAQEIRVYARCIGSRLFGLGRTISYNQARAFVAPLRGPTYISPSDYGLEFETVTLTPKTASS